MNQIMIRIPRICLKGEPWRSSSALMSIRSTMPR